MVEGKRETEKNGVSDHVSRISVSPAVGGTFSPRKGRLHAFGMNKGHRVSQIPSLQRSPCIIYGFRLGSLRFLGRRELTYYCKAADRVSGTSCA